MKRQEYKKLNESRKKLISSSRKTTAHILRQLADGVENGEILEYHFYHSSEGEMRFVVDSADQTQRLISSHNSSIGLERSSMERVTKTEVNNRRNLVLQLRKEGLTQEQIAQRTMTSQKTISNDIKILKAEGNRLK